MQKSPRDMPSEPLDLTAIFDSNEIRDTYRISYLANCLVLPVYEEIKREYGLSRGEYLLLFCLAHLPKLKAQDVANMTGRPRNSISRAVHRMHERGYLDRAPDADDGRLAWLTITRSGRKLHKRIVTKFVRRECDILDGLSKTDRNALDRILRQLVLRTAAL